MRNRKKVRTEFFFSFGVTICTFTGNHYRSRKYLIVADIQDEILMQHIKDGNLSEMAVLFERYHLRLYNFFLRLTNDRDISQDLTQNLFYRLIKYKNSYKNDLSVKSWIYKIARNIFLDYYKDERKTEELFARIDFLQADTSEKNDGFNEDDYEKLEQAFSRLPGAQKEILILSKFQGLKYEEISQIINQSVPAIKVAIHRSIKHLRSIYFKQV
jgi:RNA polymerase sigma factor (sigma-70 family)